MKKLSAIRGVWLSIFIALYAMSALGLFSSYLTFFHRSSFQLQVTEAPREMLHVLNLTKADFKKISWTEANKEFEFNGKLYDVSKIEQTDWGYLIYCENDAFEDLVFNWLKSESKSSSKGFVQIFFFEPINHFEFNPFVLASERAKKTFSNLYLSIAQELVTPPPRFS